MLLSGCINYITDTKPVISSLLPAKLFKLFNMNYARKQVFITYLF